MPSKPVIAYYTDCPFFGGCENMLVNFFADQELNQHFELRLFYRYSAAYQTGLQQRISNLRTSIPIKMLHLDDLNLLKNPVLKYSLKILSKLFLLTHLLLPYQTWILYRQFKQAHIDILHINNGGYPAARSCLAAVIAGKLCQIKSIFFVANNIAAPYHRLSRWLDYPLDRWIARNVTLFITGSAYAGQALKHVLQLPDHQLQNIPNGIQPRPVTETTEQVWQRLNLQPQGRMMFGVIALLEKRKGQIYALKAMRLLKAQIPSVQLPLLLIEGEGKDQQKLQRYVQKYNLSQDVYFLGRQAQIFNLLNAMDVLILPSIANEDFPNIILEAMSLGKPVIGAAVAGIPEQIIPQKTGLIVPPGNVVALAQAMQELNQNPKQVVTFGQAALDRFNSQFSAKISVAKYADIYRKVEYNG